MRGENQFVGRSIGDIKRCLAGRHQYVEHQKPGIEPATVQMQDESNHPTHCVFSKETKGLVWFDSDANVALCSFGQGSTFVIHNLTEEKKAWMLVCVLISLISGS